jgi:hypothetical protein
MANAKRPRPKKYRDSAEELKGYFAGELKPEVWDEIPLSLRQVECLHRTRQARGARTISGLDAARPSSEADARVFRFKRVLRWGGSN